MRDGIIPGFLKGWSAFIWMMKIVIPVSILTGLFNWSGWLQKADFLIKPVMELLSLPPIAALPLIIGMLANIYGGIAAMSVLPFSREEMTLMAIFLLIAHNMIQEGIVQGKSGIHVVKATLVRVAAAALTVMAVAPFLHIREHAQSAFTSLPQGRVPFTQMLLDLGSSLLSLGLKMFLIIIFIMVLLEIFKLKGWINHLTNILNPFLKLMGLSRQVGFLWLTAVVFGLAYGGAVIIEESKAGHLSKEELETLHLSIGINHSMVEDPTLFLSLGLSPFWLWVPRLITAVLATRMFTLRQVLRRRRQG
jgi:spore maturation protein SpmB